MGIKDFYKNIKLKYSDAFSSTWKDCYDYIYIDLNFVLHTMSYSNNADDIDVFNNLFIFLDMILRNIVPQKEIIFSCDGVAPLSKLVTQRKRRSVLLKSDIKKDKFDTINLTCGTLFMNELKSKMNDYMTFLKYTYSVDVIFLEHTIDEAELKIKKKLDDNILKDKEGTHLIYSNDADVVVMTALNDNYEKIYIMTSIGDNLLSIGKLLELHIQKYGKSKNFNLDFTAINILLGNDYIPKIACVDFDKIWNVYKIIVELNKNGLINKDMTINQDFLLNLINGIIATTRPHYIQKYVHKISETDMYKNYFDGFTWCLDTYKTGVCVRYNYMYNYKIPPHPLGIAIHLNNEKTITTLNKNTYNALNPVLYSSLVMPLSGIDCVDKKNHNTIIKINEFIQNKNLECNSNDIELIINYFNKNFCLFSI